MDYVFGFAGIPKELRDAVEARSAEFARKAKFFIDAMPAGASYRQRNVDYFAEQFRQYASTDVHQAVSLAIFYLVKDADSTRFFVDSFFPHTLMIPVEWKWNSADGGSVVKAAKSLVATLVRQVATARAALPVLKDELQSRAATTPWLLPPKNFDSNTYVATLKNLHKAIGDGFCIQSALTQHRATFVKVHPGVRISGRHRNCYVDNRGVEFHPPGNDRHGFARDASQHDRQCLLAGRWRLGAPYDRLFHYDCTKGEKKLKGMFYGCHTPQAAQEGDPHLNISPNDHVRS
ncbi:hypothetical protein ACIPZF_12045 [Pseudomonas sp. NPDC089752]|uniref:hypothetical protein n=1 Tax=Pseudomonas sp. NPDC089752 TaxID=3364472 RepID=UPI00381796D8